MQARPCLDKNTSPRAAFTCLELCGVGIAQRLAHPREGPAEHLAAEATQPKGREEIKALPRRRGETTHPKPLTQKGGERTTDA